tara:strand:- start:258 stop:359 length:102 start_codon:yes stop_codon:yes gene_type:complete
MDAPVKELPAVDLFLMLMIGVLLFVFAIRLWMA